MTIKFYVAIIIPFQERTEGYLDDGERVEVAREASPDLRDDEDFDDAGSIVSNAASSIAEMAGEKLHNVKGKLSGAIGYISGYKPDEASADAVDGGAVEAIPIAPNFAAVASMDSSTFGLPLNIFTGGNLCHPYLCLSYLDILCQPSIHGYMIGATNILFKQKKGVAEVVVDIEADRLDVLDPELKRALQLTTEDLRFVDNVIKHVSDESSDAFLDGVGWEGGDEWVRAQFRFYLVCLLRSSLETAATSGKASNPTAPSLFNSSFMNLWRKTKNYQHWRGDEALCRRVAEALPPGHPFSGHLSVDDMKLHLSNTISNTEGGKKVSAAVASTGRAVAGGFSSAKGAFSSLWSSMRQKEDKQDDEDGEENPDQKKATSES